MAAHSSPSAVSAASGALALRPVVDWSAAVWAGIGSGLVFLILALAWVPAQVGGNAWVITRLMSSPVLGEDILAPPATFDLTATLVGWTLHFVACFLFALAIAYVLHRGGLITGIVGGALAGAGLYGIVFYTATLAFPWFFAHRSVPMLLTHIAYGAVAGGIYELLEVEAFEQVDAEGGAG
ncbi:MAG: hypothetical protein AAGD01_19865 [Acidobacteriota bacterium]